MSQETGQEPALELDRERYVPDWVVEEAVGLALQTQLREPILDAVRAADGVETRSDAETGTVEGTDVEVTDEGDESTDEPDSGTGGGRRGLVGLLAVGIGLAIAYRFVSKDRE